ncbi:MAG: hypothetical protein HOO86_11960, partial [Bacteroidales bacterium]|nr:hypothetical protein [Bacteroidales bacterium]
MNILSNINTRNRLLLGNGVIIIAIIAIVVVTYSNIKSLNSTQDKIINSYEITKRLIQIRSDENRMRTLLVEMVLFKDAAKQIELEKLIMEKVNAVSKMKEEIKKDIDFLQQDIDKYKDFEEDMNEYSKIRMQQLEMTKSGKTEEVIAFIEKIVDPAWVRTRDHIYELQNAQDKHRADNLAIASSVSNNEIITLITMGIGVILLSLLIIGWMFRMLRIIFSEIKNGVAVLGSSASEILTTVTEV